MWAGRCSPLRLNVIPGPDRASKPQGGIPKDTSPWQTRMPLPNSSPTTIAHPESPGDNSVPTLEPLFDNLIKKALTDA